MKTHAIIPIFVPHEGCRNSCVFCNQQAITAREKAPDIAETESIIESHLEQIGKNPNISRVDVAFYGEALPGFPASIRKNTSRRRSDIRKRAGYRKFICPHGLII